MKLSISKAILSSAIFIVPILSYADGDICKGITCVCITNIGTGGGAVANIGSIGTRSFNFGTNFSATFTVSPNSTLTFIREGENYKMQQVMPLINGRVAYQITQNSKTVIVVPLPQKDFEKCVKGG